MALCVTIIIGLFIFVAVEGQTDFGKVCYEASRCTHRRHTRRNEKCAVNIDGTYKRFREICEMIYYNCEHHQVYVLTNPEDCSHLPKLKKCLKSFDSNDTPKITRFITNIHVSLKAEPNLQIESKASNKESMRESEPKPNPESVLKSEAESYKELKLKSKEESNPESQLEFEFKSNPELAAVAAEYTNT